MSPVRFHCKLRLPKHLSTMSAPADSLKHPINFVFVKDDEGAIEMYPRLFGHFILIF